MSRSPVADPRSPARAGAVALLIAALLAACGGSTTATTSNATTSTTATTTAATTTTTTTTTTMAPTSTTTTAAPGTTLFRGNTVTTSGVQDGEQGESLIDVRVEEHEGFTRIIFEFNGPGTPFWQVGQTQRPFFLNNDEPADRNVAGTDYLMLIVSSNFVGDDFIGSRTIHVASGPVAEVTLLGNTHTGMHWIIGTRGEKPFLGATYREPARLQLDIGA